MSRAIDWTGDMDALLREMRAEGCPCGEIAAALDVSKNAVINRCDRLGLVTGLRFRRLHAAAQQDDRDEAPFAVRPSTDLGRDFRQPLARRASSVSR